MTRKRTRLQAAEENAQQLREDIGRLLEGDRHQQRIKELEIELGRARSDQARLRQDVVALGERVEWFKHLLRQERERTLWSRIKEFAWL